MYTQEHTVMHAPDGADGLRPTRYIYLKRSLPVHLYKYVCKDTIRFCHSCEMVKK